MKLLLDTHIWLWALLEPERISARVGKELDNLANERWLSPISVWELVNLHSKKRFALDAPIEEWIASSMQKFRTIEAPFTHEVAVETAGIAIPHRDPADRFLTATANVFGLTLVTADAVLIKAKACPILAAR